MGTSPRHNCLFSRTILSPHFFGTVLFINLYSRSQAFLWGNKSIKQQLRLLSLLLATFNDIISFGPPNSPSKMDIRECVLQRENRLVSVTSSASHVQVGKLRFKLRSSSRVHSHSDKAAHSFIYSELAQIWPSHWHFLSVTIQNVMWKFSYLYLVVEDQRYSSLYTSISPRFYENQFCSDQNSSFVNINEHYQPKLNI